jgi:hypothetical protein
MEARSTEGAVKRATRASYVLRGADRMEASGSTEGAVKRATRASYVLRGADRMEARA